MTSKFSDLNKIAIEMEKKCPWVHEQTYETLSKDLLSEAKETLLAAKKGDTDNLAEELGDVLIVALMIAEKARKNGDFTVEKSIRIAIDKMVRRNPHVFGNATAKTAEEASKLFYAAKEKEKK